MSYVVLQTVATMIHLGLALLALLFLASLLRDIHLLMKGKK